MADLVINFTQLSVFFPRLMKYILHRPVTYGGELKPRLASLDLF